MIIIVKSLELIDNVVLGIQAWTISALQRESKYYFRCHFNGNQIIDR